MKQTSHFRLPRPFALIILVGVLFLLSLSDMGWVTLTQPVAGQTMPTATPGTPPSPTSDSIILPTSEPGTPTGVAGTATPTTVPTALPPPSNGTGAIVPGVQVTIPSAGGGCTAIVSADDPSEPGSVTIIEAPLNTLPNRDRNFVYLRACEVLFSDANGVLIPNYAFANPIEVCFAYTDADLARANNNPAALTILTYDPVTQTWVELPVNIDPTTRLICGQLSRTGIVALVLRAGLVSGLPNTSGSLSDATPVIVSPPQPVSAAPAVAAPAVAAPAVAAPAVAAPAANAADSRSPAMPYLLPLVAALGIVLLAIFAVLSRRIIASQRED